MQISCLQENLSRGLGVLGRITSSRTTLPITNHVLISSDQSRLKLTATNLEIAINCWIGAQIEEEGAIAIPAGLLTDFVSSLPGERIDISVANQTMELKCARFEARINGQKADEFPPIPEIGEGITTKVDAHLLRSAIAQVVFAAATDDSRPVLTGSYAQFSADKLTLAAADGFRLAVHNLPLATPVAEEVSIIIPARSLRELDRLLRDQEDPVELTINPQRSQVLFRLKNVEIVSQLIQGTFPNYNQLIPQSYTTRVVVKVAEFLRATRTASIFARDGSGIVRLLMTQGREISPGKVVITARAEEVGDNLGEIEAMIEGDEARIAFNSKYLMDVFEVLKDEQVSLEITNPSSPGVFRPIGDSDWIQVIMPMFVQW
ncbi:DNA polymerase III subunit beta [Dehalococcoidia bacterium]|nr:DNA polymerase III subunit beta [Dehalococcoidia bacterium]MCL0082367.1 DNA polymerase III subunit beta [Dehalococcoidia bacterium]